MNLNNNGHISSVSQVWLHEICWMKWRIYVFSIHIVSDLMLVKFRHPVVLWWWVNPLGTSFWRENRIIRVSIKALSFHCLLGRLFSFPSWGTPNLFWGVCVCETVCMGMWERVFKKYNSFILILYKSTTEPNPWGKRF